MPWINGEFVFEKTKNMLESHLCNTISCKSDNVTEKRKQECRDELMKRWNKSDSKAKHKTNMTEQDFKFKDKLKQLSPDDIASQFL